MNLNLNNVFYKYAPKEKTVINGINFQLNTRKLGLIGTSGSGKSTLIHMLNGLKKPVLGEITIDERIIKSDSDLADLQALRRDVAIVYQFSDSQLFAESVEEELLFAVNNFQVEIDDANEQIAKYFVQFNLDLSILKQTPHSLSGGQKKKITIITMLLIKPKMLILDEPTVGLDPQSVKEILSALEQLVQGGLSVILISHDMNVISSFCDWILEIQGGMKIFDGEISRYLQWQYRRKQRLLLPVNLGYGAVIDDDDKHFLQLLNGEKLSDLIKVKDV